MRRSLYSTLLVLTAALVFTSACGAAGMAPAALDGGAREARPRAADASLTDLSQRGIDGSCPAPPPHDLYVDAGALLGGNGSMTCPFRTITAALASIATGTAMTIHVGSGAYDAHLGETFPLTVPLDVAIVGAPPTALYPTVIDGEGPVSGFAARTAAIVLSGSLASLHVTDSSGVASTIVYVPGGCNGAIVGPGLSGVSVQGGNTAAVTVANHAGAGCEPRFTIDASNVRGSKGDGILVLPNEGDLVVTGTAIHANAGNGVNVMGASASGSRVVLGSPCSFCTTAPATPPPDEIFCNGGAGVTTSGVAQVQACLDSWNHDPPTTSGSHVDYQGAVVDCWGPAAAEACP